MEYLVFAPNHCPCPPVHFLYRDFIDLALLIGIFGKGDSYGCPSWSFSKKSVMYENLSRITRHITINAGFLTIIDGCRWPTLRSCSSSVSWRHLWGQKCRRGVSWFLNFEQRLQDNFPLLSTLFVNQLVSSPSTQRDNSKEYPLDDIGLRDDWSMSSYFAISITRTRRSRSPRQR